MSENEVAGGRLDEPSAETPEAHEPARLPWDRPGFWAVTSVSTVLILLVLRFLEPEWLVPDPQAEWERRQEELRVGYEALQEQSARARERLQADMAEAHRRGIDRLVTENGGIELVRVPGGSFIMGSPEDEEGRWGSDNSVHRVTVPEFFIGSHEVTVEQYGRFLAANPWASPPGLWEEQQAHPRRPVVFVGWKRAKTYCKWVGGRLPTEAEWERACRAETTTRFWSGDEVSDLARVGWYQENSSERAHDVGELPANAFGLHDVHGNVSEWCNAGEQVERSHWSEKFSVLRGGSWTSSVSRCRSAARSSGRRLDGREPWFGFRACGGTVPGLEDSKPDEGQAGEAD
ncbi:MAG: formylglycine-generating enzyme family protein [Acidobacteriota bacterium]